MDQIVSIIGKHLYVLVFAINLDIGSENILFHVNELIQVLQRIPNRRLGRLHIHCDRALPRDNLIVQPGHFLEQVFLFEPALSSH